MTSFPRVFAHSAPSPVTPNSKAGGWGWSRCHRVELGVPEPHLWLRRGDGWGRPSRCPQPQADAPSFHRAAGSDDRGDDGCAHVLPHLHIQQQQHPLHHGHLEEAEAGGRREGAALGGQVGTQGFGDTQAFGETGRASPALCDLPLCLGGCAQPGCEALWWRKENKTLALFYGWKRWRRRWGSRSVWKG